MRHNRLIVVIAQKNSISNYIHEKVAYHHILAVKFLNRKQKTTNSKIFDRFQDISFVLLMMQRSLSKSLWSLFWWGIKVSVTTWKHGFLYQTLPSQCVYAGSKILYLKSIRMFVGISFTVIDVKWSYYRYNIREIL